MRYTEAYLIQLLKKQSKEAGSQRQLAIKLKISPAFLSDMLLGRRAISETVAAKLGFKREVAYIKTITFLPNPKGGE